MGKKKSSKFQIQKQDVFHRLNFLYQAAHLALLAETPNIMLAQHYTSTMVTLAQKNVLRLSPHIKRNFCKVCKMLLLPGVSCKVRYRGKKIKRHINKTCLQCGTIKKFLFNPDHVLWNDKPENIDQIVTLEVKQKT